MKIERIHLKNIYAHVDTCVDLTSTPTAVVVGDNGAGKSSLFTDGPLFALFGKPAVRADTYADVIRRGAEEGTAVVTFAIDGERYRVARSYSVRTKAGSSSLEFVRWNGSEWAPAATGSITEVEAAIVKLLGCDYSTFTLGAVMRQDEAARFSKATSTERVEALSAILGVEHLREAYTVAGREKSKAEAELASANEKLAEAKAASAERDDLAEELADLEKDLDEVGDDVDVEQMAEELERLEDKRDELEQAVETFERKRSQYDENKDSATELERRLAKVDKRLAELLATAKPLHEATEVDVDIYPNADAAKSSGYTLRKKHDEASAAGLAAAKLEAERDHVVASIDERREKIEAINAEKKELRDELRPLFDSGELDAFAVECVEEAEEERREELEGLVGTWQALEKEKAAVVELERQAKDVERRRDEKRGHIERRMKAIDNRNADVDLEKCQKCGLLADAMLAKKELDELLNDGAVVKAYHEAKDARREFEDKRAELELEDEESFERKRDELAERYNRIRRARPSVEKIERLSRDAGQLFEEVEELEDKRNGLGERLVELQAKADGAEELAEQLEQARDAYRALKRKEEADEKLEKIWKERDELAERREELVETLNGLEESLEIRREYLEAEELVEGLHGANATREQLSTVRDKIREERKGIDAAKTENAERESKRARLREKAARLETKLETLEPTVAKAGELEAERDELRRQVANLGYARKFYKKAPGVVVASAIPRLEKEANDVLAELAPGFRVRIRRQKQGRDGNARDEIHVEVAVRGVPENYANLSGGEKFRVDLALRLGLARAAAGRDTGRPIQVLMIDEGFGSLDKSGRQAARDALLRLRERFAQIYAITHVDDIRDTFGATIELESSQNGPKVITG